MRKKFDLGGRAKLDANKDLPKITGEDLCYVKS
jgi:hypothetical protein